MAVFLTGSSVPSRPAVLGVVVQANRAHLNTTAVTNGATVYDGDRFSTEAGGMLFLQGRAASLELATESVAAVRSRANGAQGAEAELSRGTLVFKAERSTALEVVVREVRIRPASETQTIGQMSVLAPNGLIVCARRGSLQLLYRGEMETIDEGRAYRVILDPAENGSDKDKKGPVNDRKKKAFILISLVGVPALIYGLYKGFEYESPDRP